MQNTLMEKFGDDKLAILAFPSNQHGFQEWFGDKEILNALKHLRPGEDFVPKAIMLEKTKVCGDSAHPILKALQMALPVRNTTITYESEHPFGIQGDAPYQSTTCTLLACLLLAAFPAAVCDQESPTNANRDASS